MSVKDGTVEVDGKKYDVVTLDYETFYGKDFTLSGRMNTSEYVRDPRFHVHGIGIKIKNGKTRWYTGKNIALALKEIDWSRSAMLAHNTAFDGFISAEVYDVHPAFYLDTLSMARAAHGHSMRHNLDTIAKAHGLAGKVKKAALVNTKDKQQLTQAEEMSLGSYCVDDVNDCYSIFWKLIDYIPDDELKLIDLTLRMFTEPVLLVDIPRVQKELEKEVGAKMAAILTSGATVPELMSNQKFAALLERNGVTPATKVSSSTGKMTYAFAKSDLEFQELLNNPNKKVAALAQARMRVRSTIGETRAMRFIDAGKDGYRLPVLLNYSGAHTHRWSGGNKMNLQNLKRDSELRRSILAPKGEVIVVSDSSQIEARVLAWLAGQQSIIDAFAAKKDVYKMMASLIYGVPVDKISKEQRFIGKICVLGLGFGMGARRLQRTLRQGLMGPPVDMTLDECQRIVSVYRAHNPYIARLWKTMDSIIAAMIANTPGKYGPLAYGKGFVKLPNGLFMQYPGLHGEMQARRDDLTVEEASYLTRRGMCKIYGGLLTENCVQALARVLVGEQMLRVAEKYRIVTMTHDEIVVVCPEEKADVCLRDMISIMSTASPWAKGLPLSAEGGWAANYSK